MILNDVHQGVHTNKAPNRVGRGPGSGHGKTSARGHKGQRSRSGYSSPMTFEGGQNPLIRRVPKRGFNNRFADTVAVINVSDLESHFESGSDVTVEAIRAAHLARGRFDQLKVLGDGALTKKLKVAAHQFSRTAAEKIQQAGGEVVVLPGKKPVTRNKMKKAKQKA